MLYVVFTFGEMIIALEVYFNNGGKWNGNTIYFSLMAFLIVVGLFLSYGYMYDHILDREGDYNGIKYMLIHIFIIFALNNITASLEFMRESEINLLPKMLFLIGSLVAYFAFLLSLKGFAKIKCKPTKSLIIKSGCATALFVGLMLLFRENMYINIFISAVYVFLLFIIMYTTYKNADKA